MYGRPSGRTSAIDGEPAHAPPLLAVGTPSLPGFLLDPEHRGVSPDSPVAQSVYFYLLS